MSFVQVTNHGLVPLCGWRDGAAPSMRDALPLSAVNDVSLEAQGAGFGSMHRQTTHIGV
jgi:hypothetical protein